MFNITDSTANTQHRHQIHVVACDPVTGAYSTVDGGAHPEASIWDTVPNYMDILKNIFNTPTTISFVQALAVVSGVASSYMVPPGTITPRTGAVSTGGNGFRAAQSTLTGYDAYQNQGHLVVFGVHSAWWYPDALKTVLPDTAGTIDNWQELVAYLLGILPASGARLPRVCTHAGNVFINRFQLTSTLNRRLRRQYHIA